MNPLDWAIYLPAVITFALGMQARGDGEDKGNNFIAYVFMFGGLIWGLYTFTEGAPW